MNKRIIAILSLLIVVAGASAVSAFGFDDLMGGDSNETVTINGFDFNVPAGFEEDANYSKENESASVGVIDYTYDQKLFEKGPVAVSILVADYGENKVTDDVVAAIGGNQTTIAGIDGYLDYNNGIYSFNYAKNDKLVTITSSDEDVISDFIIA
ncbi:MULTISPECIES: hypothetical protein [Methanobrevibacter]|jgi:hypothetical protein|uniref:DUF4367 domain-containing protein n=1 Tax=Methanobrevibacter thaueri TaxID=190975 RepID=A0A315XKH0_9EURY|nr:MULTISPECIES: hypothetical protein [Methanobrevibacter]MBR2664870.1 hypothetical protein [Methanobrevibacter sp.]MBR3140468.1 hypothetical protein [Methanobrevibacter sp.]MBR3198183.1 hypothetical protein [Methanobrevibacter sp.]MBR7050196.1 hypothetical protein [Methanobrevibacter sp.]PWB85291.1 hypothetical protein MBBTH_18900 [Methanobrevibacter thaueri]